MSTAPPAVRPVIGGALPGDTPEAAPAPSRPRVTHPRPRVDPQAAERAAVALLTALGMDLEDPVITDTPRRMADALLEMTTARDFELTTFPHEGEPGQLVVVEDIPVQSLCEHHVLPFVGVAHVGQLPGSRILGLSKFARLVDFHARRPQTQERLTDRIVETIDRELAPYGVGVVVEAEHTCLSLRGARAPGCAHPHDGARVACVTTPRPVRSSWR